MNKLVALCRFYLPLFFQIFRFGVVGLTAAFVHFGVVVLLVQNVRLTPLNANIFGFMVASQVSYWGHRIWTFEARDTLHSIALPRILLVQMFNFAANQTLFYIFLTLHLPYTIALIVVLTVLPIFTFLSNKFWVFR